MAVTNEIDRIIEAVKHSLSIREYDNGTGHAVAFRSTDPRVAIAIRSVTGTEPTIVWTPISYGLVWSVEGSKVILWVGR